MAIHPIEYRYGTPQMRAIWEEEHRFYCIVATEIALAEAEASCGLIPHEAAAGIKSNAHKATLRRAKEIEAAINHDMMAVVRAIAEQCGDAGGWVHYGATSNDILDTATGLQLRDSLALIDVNLRRFLATLLARSASTKNLVCSGRTHGQIGVPTTYGLRFAIWASEIGRHIERIGEARKRIAVGKLTGAVGTQASLGEKGLEIQAGMMDLLGLGSVDVANQVVSRDRHAEYIMILGNIATTLDKIGIEIRSLQRTEIGELEEAFGTRQVGSSTMPHKRNPIRSEQVCGLARVIRSSIEPALLNNTLWDERDLTNSSCERVILPETSVLADHILNLADRIIGGLTLHPDSIRRNLACLQGINMAEPVMLELAKRGLGRQEAHELLRIASMQALSESRPLVDVLSEREIVLQYLSRGEIETLLDPDNYIGTAVVQVERVITKLSPLATDFK